jgi:hypothetical protein
MDGAGANRCVTRMYTTQPPRPQAEFRPERSRSNVEAQRTVHCASAPPRELSSGIPTSRRLPPTGHATPSSLTTCAPSAWKTCGPILILIDRLPPPRITHSSLITRSST